MPRVLSEKTMRLPSIKRNKIAQFILDILFPAFCIGCQKEAHFLCADCREKIIIQRVPSLLHPRAVHTVHAACAYSQPLVSTLIKQLKYNGIKENALHCAELIISHLLLTGFTAPENAVVVPVPLSRRRLAQRGFNQSALVALHIAYALSLPCAQNALTRIRHTAPQTEKKERKDRIENVKGAFACAALHTVKGKNIILIDDVITTGATMSECAKALKSAGAKKVIALVVAS